MLTIKPASLLLILFTALLFTNAPVVSGQEKPALNRSVLLENSVELPGSPINTKVMRVIFPPAFKTPLHTHDGPGPRYVVKGNLKVTESGKTHTYSAGEVFWESGQSMAVENIGEGVAELIIFELAPVK